jgi:pimeloyl-ACP methyl ester carboxylesterase
MPDSTRPRELVFLLHGIAAPSWMMTPLARRLEAAGYVVNNWGYRSIRRSIDEHGERLARELQRVADESPTTKVHVVAHSMGSIVTRDALVRGLPKNLGRVVFLGPPHGGSPMASLFGPWLRPLCRPIDQLAARAGSFVNCLGALEGVEFGVIAASLDVLVPLASTHLAGQREHVVLRSMHSQLLFRTDVAAMTGNFLRHGAFAGAHNVS